MASKGASFRICGVCACLTLPLLAFSSSHRFWIVPTEPAHPVGMAAVFPALLAASLVLIRHALGSSRPVGLKTASFLPALLLVGFLIHRALLLGEEAAAFAVPFSNSRLMQSVSELQELNAEGWKAHFSALPIIAALGVVGAWVRLWKRRGGSSLMESTLFATAWIGLWGYMSVGSVRYTAMLAPALAAMSAVAFVWIGNTIQPCLDNGFDQRGKIRGGFAAREGLRYLYVTLIPMAILYWGPAGRIVPQSAVSAVHRPPRPSMETTEAYRWISKNIESNGGGERPVVAARWGVGSQLNVLADARTIDD